MLMAGDTVRCSVTLSWVFAEVTADPSGVEVGVRVDVELRAPPLLDRPRTAAGQDTLSVARIRTASWIAADQSMFQRPPRLADSPMQFVEHTAPAPRWRTGDPRARCSRRREANAAARTHW